MRTRIASPLGADRVRLPLRRRCRSVTAGIGSLVLAGVVACSRTADGAARDATAAPVTLERPPVARRVWSGAVVDPTLRPSYDGRYVAFIDPQTGDVALHDLATGKDRRLTATSGESPTGDFFDTPVAGPGAHRIAFSSWSGAANRLELGVVDDNGRRAAPIASSAAGAMVPLAWSRDGARIAVVLPSRDAVTELGVVDTSGMLAVVPGGARFVGAEGEVQFAGDSRTLLANVRQRREPSDSFDVVAVDVASGRSWPVVTHSADDRLAGLTPDGRVVLFFSDRGGTMSLYGQAVTNELRPIGEPVIVKPDLWSGTALGTTADGSLLYTIQTGVQTLYSVQLDPTTGATGAPRAIGIASGVSRVPVADWTGGGASTVQNFRPGRGRGGHMLTVRSVLSGDMREIVTPLSEINALHASPDGAHVLINGRDDRNRIGVYLVDVATGATRAIANASFESPAMVRAAGWSADSRSAFYTVEDFRRDRLRLVSHDASGTAERTVLEIPCTSGCGGRASPDGRLFAIVQRAPDAPATTRLLVIPAGDTTPRELARATAPDRFVAGPAWTPDGRSVIIALGTSDEAASHFARFVVAHVDGTPATTATVAVPGPVSGLRVHPSGREILFFSGETAFELWSLDQLRFRPSR
jgi:dipeptidyl aminopeptidase/acylaminoacyl peptidase